jgi:hypothetical protein
MLEVVEWFSKKYNTMLFIHFDEVDAVLDIHPKVELEHGDHAAKRCYEFWIAIHPILCWKPRVLSTTALLYPWYE